MPDARYETAAPGPVPPGRRLPMSVQVPSGHRPVVVGAVQVPRPPRTASWPLLSRAEGTRRASTDESGHPPSEIGLVRSRSSLGSPHRSRTRAWSCELDEFPREGKAMRAPLRLHAVVLGAVAALVLSACGGGGSDDTDGDDAGNGPVKGGTITFLTIQDQINHLDPQR